MKRWLWVALMVVPLACGGMGAVLFWLDVLPNRIAYLRIDLGTLFLLLGLMTGSVMLGEALRRVVEERRQRVFLQRMQAEMVNERHEFLRRLDHELKNPLMAMRAGLANLTGTELDAPQREIIESVETQILRLSRLLADLRKLAELEIRPLDCAPVDVNELLQDVLTMTEERPEAEGRQITLTLPQAPWPLPPVSGDHDLLFLLVHNLLDNALKFTRPGDKIELRAFEDGARVVVEVADTGAGIPEKDALLVWNELYRGENARGVPGSGIGLSLVRAIAERHHGEVFLRSRLGQGTVFTLRLPVYRK
ncbi:MAG: sensor histidine kinase [Anaerolineae bacterium]|nr:MAG: sensor histidine kinase [Anaerolineae bacterium]